MANLSLADVFFDRWIADHHLSAAFSNRQVAMNDALLAIAIGYIDLVEAHGQLANARTIGQSADEMVDLVNRFVVAGMASRGDLELAETERGLWQQRVGTAERRAAKASAELARLLRLDPSTPLLPADEKVVPLELIVTHRSDEEWVAMAIMSRPELGTAAAHVAANADTLAKEQWRPWLPQVVVGTNGGSFGGGFSTNSTNQGSRSDVDLAAVWEIENAGFGLEAKKRRHESQLRQAEFQESITRDAIATQVVTAAADTRILKRQSETAMANVESAGQSFHHIYEQVFSGEATPLELIQAINARSRAVTAYTEIIAEFNRAQFRLMRAAGMPPEVSTVIVPEGIVVPEE